MPARLSKRISDTVKAAVVTWVDCVCRFAWVVVIGVLATSAGLTVYTARNLGINTDVNAMLSSDLPFRRAYADFTKAFPYFTNALVILVEGDNVDLAEDGARALYERLRRDGRRFKSIYYPAGHSYFRKNGLLFLDTDELARLADRIAEAQPLLATLARDPSLRGLFEVLGLAADNLGEGGEPAAGLDRALDRVSAVVEAHAAGRPASMSWSELLRGEAAAPRDRRRIIVVQPELDWKSLKPAAKAMQQVRAMAAELKLDPAHGVRVRLTGTAAIDSEEFDSVARGAGLAGMISLVLVSVLLTYGLRSIRLVVSVLVTLVVGLIFTAAFAAVAIGHLNMISVAFAVLFIGLGADFGIHFALRYQEAIEGRVEHRDALTEAAIGVGGALTLSAGAAAIAFYSFFPTSYLGVSELGLIAGTGMFVALIMNFTLLPAILTLLPLSPPARPRRQRRFGVAAGALIERHSRSIALGALAVGLTGLALVPQVRFDYNPINLKDFSTESVQAIRDLMRDSKTAPYTIGIIADDLDAADRLAARIKPLAVVDNAITLRDYVPNNQKEKLEIVDTMSVFLTPIIENTEIVARPSAAERAASLDAFRAKIDHLLKSGGAGALTPNFSRLGAALDRFAKSRSDGEGLAALEVGLVGSLGARLDDLRLSLTAAPVTLASVPDDIRVRQVTGDGRARIEVFPAEDIIDNEAMRRFVSAVRGVAPNATDTPVLLLEAGDAIVGAFTQATITALVLITLLLLTLLRRVTDVLLVFAPLFLATSLTVALSVLLGLWLNFANIIVLPLLLGLGVASGIHIVMRARRGHFSSLLGTSTPRAVVFSALTTVCSFGSLSVSGHRGTASMGELLMIAIGFTLICALIVLPGLMKLISHGGAKSGRAR